MIGPHVSLGCITFKRTTSKSDLMHSWGSQARQAEQLLAALAILIFSYTITQTESTSICSFSLVADARTGALPVRSKRGAECRCSETAVAGADNAILYPLNNTALKLLCNPSGGSTGPWITASVPSATALMFRGSDVILDGSSATGATAEGLDLSHNGPDMPLFYFYNVNGLSLRNLLFRNLTTSGPLVLLEGCTNVTMHNVTFQDVRVTGLGSGTALHDDGAVDSITRAKVASAGALVSISKCTGGCDVRNLRFEDVSLTEGWAALRVAASPGLQLEGVTVAGASCSGATGAVVQVTDGGNMATTSVVLSGLRLQGGCPGLALRGESGGMVVTNITIKDSSVSSGGAAVQLSRLAFRSDRGARRASLRGITLSSVTLSGRSSGVLVEGSKGAGLQDIVFRNVGPPPSLASGVAALVSVSASQAVGLDGIGVWPPGKPQRRGPVVMWVAIQGCAQVAVANVRNHGSSGRSLEGSSTAISVMHSTSVQISDVQLVGIHGSSSRTVQSFNAAVRLVNVSLATLERITLEDFLSNGPFHGVLVTKSSNLTASNLIIQNFTSEPITNATALHVRDTTNLAVIAMICNKCNTGAGPCLTVVGSSVTVSNGTFTSNSATGKGSAGGAICLLRGSATVSSLRVHSSVFARNNADIGGAIALTNSTGDIATTLLLVNTSRFSGNIAKLEGGDITARGGSLSIISSNFTGGKISGSEGRGGSIFTLKSHATITASRFIGCSSAVRGGAMYFELAINSTGSPPAEPCAISLADCCFEDNISGEGGAVFINNGINGTSSKKKSPYAPRRGDSGAITPCETNMKGVLFRNNSATVKGGGALSMQRDGAATKTMIANGNFRGVRLINNRALGSGGALAASGWHLDLTDANFVGNSVTGGLEPSSDYQDYYDVLSGALDEDSSGGAVFLSKCSSTVHIRNATFTGNSALYGGALGTVACNVSVQGATFDSNVAETAGGAVLVVRDYESSPPGNAVVFEVLKAQFTTNTASKGYGGALTAYGVINLEVTDADFTNNTADFTGGAMYLTTRRQQPVDVMTSGVARATLRNARFSDNTASSGGGALLMSGWHLLLEDARFTGNNAKDIFPGNEPNFGGAVMVSECPKGSNAVDIRNVHFISNEGFYGGALGVNWCNVSIDNATFSFNKAGYEGGAVLVAGYTKRTDDGKSAQCRDYNLKIRNSRFESNTADVSGGGVSMSCSHAEFTDTVFIKNGGAEKGGAAFFEPSADGALSRGTLNNVSFYNNSGQAHGGALMVVEWNFELNDVRFVNNSVNVLGEEGSSAVAGGAIFLVNCTGTVLMSKVTLSENKAYQGGAMGTSLCNVSMQNSTFQGNVATRDAGAVLIWGGMDGTKSKRPYSLDVNTTIFEANTAQGGQGGAIKVFGAAGVTITRTNFRNNSAKTDGGAVYLEMVSPKPPPVNSTIQAKMDKQVALFEKCEFRLNIAYNSGGALYNSLSAVRITNCTLHDNLVGNGAYSVSDFGACVAEKVTSGGAIFSSRCTAPLVLSRSELKGNQADGQGGAVTLMSCAANLDEVSLVGNSAKLSGGCIFAGIDKTNNTIAQPAGSGKTANYTGLLPILNINNCDLFGNIAVCESGGSVHTNLVPLVIRGSRLTRSKAKLTGGAVYSIAAPMILLFNSSLEGNNAGVSGGAVWAESCDMFKVEDATVADNTAVSSGGGLVLLNSKCADMKGLQLADNSAAMGGGAYFNHLTGFSAAITGYPEKVCFSRPLDEQQQLVGDWQVGPLIMRATNINATGNRALEGQGGALLFGSMHGSLLLDRLIASSNGAKTDGGALAMSDAATYDATLYISSSLLYGNTAAGRGGALWFAGSRAQVVALNTTMQRNLAASGGAVGLQGNASLALHGCTLEDNVAEGGLSGGGSGGSVYAASCNRLMLNDTTVSTSTAASGDGGGLFSDGCSVVLLSRTMLHRNNAMGSGGAAHVNAVTASSLMLVLGSNMSYNKAGSSVGSVASSGSKSISAKNLPAALGWGGALYLGGAVAALADRTIFEYNVADVMGGAVGIDLDCRQAAAAPTADVSPTAVTSAEAALPLDAKMSGLSPGVAELLRANALVLQELRRVANRSSLSGCWRAVFNLPRLWGNTAGASGGAVYLSSPYTLNLLCGDGGQPSSTSVTSDQELAVLLSVAALNSSEAVSVTKVASIGEIGSASTSLLANLRDSSGRSSSSAATSEKVRTVCFQPATPADSDTVPINQAIAGYGNDLATIPEHLVLAAMTESDQSVQVMPGSGNIANLVNAADPFQTKLHSADILQSRDNVTAFMDSAGGAPPSPTSSRTNSAAVSGALPWLRRAVLEVNGRAGANECWLGQDCRIFWPSNVAVIFNMSVYDALRQITNDTSTASSAIAATIEVIDPNSQADLLGIAVGPVSSGVASMAGLRVRARKGNYSLRLQLVATAAGIQVEPLLLNVTVPPCALGEISLDDGFLCVRCSANTFNLVADLEDGGGNNGGLASSAFMRAASGNSMLNQCSSCPDNAICPGGAVVVPQQGYWHSAANSTVMHQCPNSEACRDGDAARNAALVRCQERWHAYFGSTRRFRPLLEDDQGGATVVGAYLDVYRMIKEDSTALPSTPLLPDGSFDGFLLDCAIWGVPNNHSMSYMQMQCAQGYDGILCATCTTHEDVHYALNSDFICSRCFNKWETILIGVSVFFANTIWLGFSVLMTFLTDYRYAWEDEGVPAADSLKMLTTHYQYFLIATRINMGWPNSVVGLQSALGSVLGSVKQVYSPSCLWPGADSATHATVQVMAGLLLPIFSVLVVMLLWTVRFIYWNQGCWWNERRLQKSTSHSSTILAHIDLMAPESGATEDHAINPIAGQESIRTNSNNMKSSIGKARALNDFFEVSVATWPMRPRQASLHEGAALVKARAPSVALEVMAGGIFQGANSVGARADGNFDGVGSGSSVPFTAISVDQPQLDGAQWLRPQAASAAAVEVVLEQLPVSSCVSRAGTTTIVAQVESPICHAPRAPSCDSSRVNKAVESRPEYGCEVVLSGSTANESLPPLPGGPSRSGQRRLAMANSGCNVGIAVDLLENQQTDNNSRPPPRRPSFPAGSHETVSNPTRAAEMQQVHQQQTPPYGQTGMPSPIAESTRCAGDDANSEGGAQQQQVEDQRLSRLSSIPSNMPDPKLANSSEGKGMKFGFTVFRKRESLSFMDANMSLSSQLFLVLMVTSFVLMPTWATEALSIFSCYKLDNGAGDYPQNQRATWKYGYWVRDMNQECYTGRHLTLWVPIGVVSVMVLCLAMPLICAKITFAHRKRLHEVAVVQVYGFLYRSYKDMYYFWESLSQAQMLLLVVVEVFGRALVVFRQALLLEVILMLILMSNTYFSPLLHDELTDLQLLSLGVICLTVMLGMLTSISIVSTTSSATEALLGAIILIINCSIILAFIWLLADNITSRFRGRAVNWTGKLQSAHVQIKKWMGRTP